MKNIIVSLVLASLLTACGSPDYLKIAGGGISFNYRYSQAFMVVIAQQKKPLPEGSVVLALFDIPGSTARQTVQLPALPGKLTYKLETEPLQGFVKGGQYKVTLTLVDKDGKTLDSHDTVFTSDENQSSLPSKPLVDGLEFTPHLENL